MICRMISAVQYIFFSEGVHDEMVDEVPQSLFFSSVLSVFMSLISIRCCCVRRTDASRSFGVDRGWQGPPLYAFRDEHTVLANSPQVSRRYSCNVNIRSAGRMTMRRTSLLFHVLRGQWV